MFDWNQVETVFFDMDGTLLDLHFDNFFWLQHLPVRLSELNNISLDMAQEQLRQMFEAHQGTLKWYCLDFWSKELKLDIAELKEEVSSKICYRPHVEPLLSQLCDSNIELAIVTNAHRGSVEIKLENTTLARYFDEIISSHDIGVEKESLDFWTKLHKSRAFNPAKTVFFDDNEDVLRAAQEFGISTLFSIEKPDSQKPRRIENNFSMVKDFSDFFLPKENVIL